MQPGILEIGTFGNPSEMLPDILTFAALSFFATLTAGVSAYKMLKWKGEKLVMMASRFAAGVFFGTAMIDLLSEADLFFHWSGLRYPMAFLFLCTGYGMAMLIDCLLAHTVRRLSRGCFKKFPLKSSDKFILTLASDLESNKCCDATVPTGTETKDCDGIGDLQYFILYRATLVVDFIFLSYPLIVLSTIGGAEIGNAKTNTQVWRTFLNTTSHNVIYMVSLVFTGLRFIRSNIPFAVCLIFMVLFSTLSPIGTMIQLLFWNDDFSTLGREPYDQPDDHDWTVGIILGSLSGILMYISVHHLLADGYELERSVSGTRFSKLVAMVAGVGLIALLKVLSV